MRICKMQEDAEQRIEERRAETEAALNVVAELVEEGCHEQVIAFVEGLPERVAAVAQIQELVAASKRIWEEEWALLQRLGACYAGLRRDQSAGRWGAGREAQLGCGCEPCVEGAGGAKQNVCVAADGDESIPHWEAELATPAGWCGRSAAGGFCQRCGA